MESSTSLKKTGIVAVGWYHLAQKSLSIFKPVRETKTWGEARSYCLSLGGDLASPSSAAETDFIQNNLAPKKGKKIFLFYIFCC